MLICWPCLVVRPAFMMKRLPAIGRPLAAPDERHSLAIDRRAIHCTAGRDLMRMGRPDSMISPADPARVRLLMVLKACDKGGCIFVALHCGGGLFRCARNECN